MDHSDSDERNRGFGVWRSAPAGKEYDGEHQDSEARHERPVRNVQYININIPVHCVSCLSDNGSSGGT